MSISVIDYARVEDPPSAPCALESGFTMPERCIASAIPLDKHALGYEKPHGSVMGSRRGASEIVRRVFAATLASAANASATGWEGFAAHMRLAPCPLAESHINRSGPVSRERLAGIAPRFISELNQRDVA